MDAEKADQSVADLTQDLRQEPDPVEGSDAEKQLQKTTPAAEEKDPNVVDWDGPDDPENPMNWSNGLKMANIILLGLSVLCTNLATTAFAPASPQLADEFNVTSSILITLTVTIPSLGAAAGPLLFAPLSELYGRVWIYWITSVLFLAFATGIARSTDIAMFLVFRFFDGVCFASFLTCGGGTIADLFARDGRGAASAIFAMAPLLGPVAGPIIGGFVAESLGWRWVFYIVLMIAGIVTIASFILMRETKASIVLAKKAARLRKATGNPNLRPAASSDLPARQVVSRALTRPIRMLLFSPMVLLLGLYLAFVFGLTYLLLATFPMVFEETYGFGVGVSGLAYIGLGVGCIIGTILSSKFSDQLVKKVRTPERRLILMIWGGPFVPASMFWYGWTAEYHVHWSVPIIGTAFIGIGIIFVTTSGQLYTMDTFGAEGAASALAAITVVRNGSGAFLPLAATPLYDKLGLGWGNSVLAFISLAFWPVAFLFYRYGERLREKYVFKL